MQDDAGRVVASGRVRLLCLDAGAPVAGEGVEVKIGPGFDSGGFESTSYNFV